MTPAGGAGGGTPGTGSGRCGYRGAGAAPNPRLPPSELWEKSGKSVGESRAASGEGPAERLAGGGGSILPAGFGFPGLAGAAGEERVGEKKTKNEEEREKKKAFSFCTAFPFFAASCLNFLLYLVGLVPSLAPPHRGTRAALRDFGTEVPLGTIKSCEPLLEGMAGLSPRLEVWHLDAQRAKPAPLQLTVPV